MKIALIQPANTTNVIRILDGVAASTRMMSVAASNGPAQMWDFISGDDGWAPVTANRNVPVTVLASADHEASARFIYRIPSSVELYTTDEISEMYVVLQ